MTAPLQIHESPNPDRPEAERRRWMAVLARAGADALRPHRAGLPPHSRLRGPEIGLVMLRGRMGGDGAPFNLTEATVTRCTVEMAGRLGHATVLGRDLEQAELAAALDAALQDPALRPALLESVIAPLATAQAERRARDARRAEATRVQFFTMATMR
jgi:alpha-D-ribose 1-methylphosphonate 5-triphosphate synthase subunit PhnG